MERAFGPRRATWVDMPATTAPGSEPLSPSELAAFETLDLLYRSLCALLYNYAPTSGHPGGSISSGRFVAAALFDSLDYDLADPERDDADLLTYAAGHKAMGLYAMWALRDEIARLEAPELLPAGVAQRLRPRRPARLSPQPDDHHTAVSGSARQGSRRSPHAGDTLRAAGHRRLRCRSGELDRTGHRRPRLLR
ncbi:MAG: hypothetical protein ACXVP1_00010 [Thermoleophilia bacterium]